MLALSACASDEELGYKEPAREGLAVTVGGIDYNVFITRQLNLRDPEDRAYYAGAEAPPGSTYYGVFIQACNRQEGDDAAADATEHFRVVDSQGNEFAPRELPPGNIFAYRARRLAPEQCIPEAGTIAAGAPAAGALLLFELPLAATENRPLELEITSPATAAGAEHRKGRVELDV